MLFPEAEEVSAGKAETEMSDTRGEGFLVLQMGSLECLQLAARPAGACWSRLDLLVGLPRLRY